MTSVVQSPERLRSQASLRSLVQESHLRVEDLVLPVFLNEATTSKDISSMPGVRQWSVEESLGFVAGAAELGIRSFMLFGIVGSEKKDAQGSMAWSENQPVVRALQKYSKNFGSTAFNWFADLCFCEYTSHGHCGTYAPNSSIRDRDATLKRLGQSAVVLAQAGASVIAPSGMVDGMVSTIRNHLDEASHSNVSICSYAVKYASAFYGPFREAAENAPQFGDRRSYQMNPANVREAIREAELDVAQGADLLLVKPAMAYADVVAKVAQSVRVPVGAYQVSGEYSMIRAAGAAGWIDESAVFMESLLSLKRAGASFIISYWAAEAARQLRS